MYPPPRSLWQRGTLPWFVLETTGSAARTGIVSGALAMGAVIPAVLGGPLVDRLGFKRSSVLADLASAAVVAARGRTSGRKSQMSARLDPLVQGSPKAPAPAGRARGGGHQ